MPLIKDGEKVKVKKKMLAKITMVRISVMIILIIIPIYLAGLIKVFFEGRDRLPLKTSCAVVIMPDYGTGSKPSFYFSRAIETAIFLKNKSMVKEIIFTGIKGQFDARAVAAIRKKLDSTPVKELYPYQLTFIDPVEDYEQMALSIQKKMNEKKLFSANLVNTSYYMGKTMLYFRRANEQEGGLLTFKGFPVIVDEEQKREAKDWWYIYREALYYIYYYLFARPGAEAT